MNNISMSARMPEGSPGKRFQTQHALGGISYSGIYIVVMMMMMMMMMVMVMIRKNKNREGSKRPFTPAPPSGAEELELLN